MRFPFPQKNSPSGPQPAPDGEAVSIPAAGEESPAASAPTPAENAQAPASPSAPAQVREQEEHLEGFDADYPEVDGPEAPALRRKPVPAELIMILIAAAALVLLLVAGGYSLYYTLTRDEDPQSLPGYHMDASPTQIRETILEPSIPATPPENPTIPPARNPYGRFDFQYNRRNYLLLQNLESYPGVDVSAHQGAIDWQAVADSGIDFAFIRLGYRGYGSGKLVEDDYAQRNLSGAYDAGLRIGAYFFSQALNQREVDEEIEFMMNILGDQPLDMPIILDWEIPADDARTAGVMDARTLTDLQLHFCAAMKEKGYQPMVYFNWHQSENLYYLSELEDYPFWLALYQDRMTYPWHVEFWQYSDHGRVPGIQGPVDMDVYMPS